jgi:hypothetical protein
MKYYIDTEFNERGHEHPIELISIAIVAEDDRELYRTLADGWSTAHANDWVRANVLPHIHAQNVRTSRENVARAIKILVGSDPSPEFWGYYADYDWVLFCQLFGAMVDLPKGFPMFCRDLIQEAKRLGLADEMKAAVPIVGTAHNALDDARNIKARHEWLMQRVKR